MRTKPHRQKKTHLSKDILRLTYISLNEKNSNRQIRHQNYSPCIPVPRPSCSPYYKIRINDTPSEHQFPLIKIWSSQTSKKRRPSSLNSMREKIAPSMPWNLGVRKSSESLEKVRTQPRKVRTVQEIARNRNP